MTRSRHLSRRSPSDASRRLFKSKPLQAGLRLRSVIADRRWTGHPSGPEGERYPYPSGEIDHLFDPRGRTAAGQGGSLPSGIRHKAPEPGHRICAADQSTGSGVHRRATERFQMTRCYGYPSCSRALSTARAGLGRHSFQAWADVDHVIRFMRRCQEQYANASRAAPADIAPCPPASAARMRQRPARVRFVA